MEHKEGSKAKRMKSTTVQHWDRDIVCLPQQYHKSSSNTIPFPRGCSRVHLGKSGLIGKIHLSSTMTVNEVAGEIRSVFSKAMNGCKDFPFVFLQSTGCGSRSLTLPSVSTSFSWTPQMVARLGSVKQPIYILAQQHLATYCEVRSCKFSLVSA